MDRRNCTLLLVVLLAGGCYAPLKTPAIPASDLPDSFRARTRHGKMVRNMASLSLPYSQHVLGPGDVVEITIPGLFRDSEFRPLRFQLTENGKINLPSIGSIQLGGTTLQQAHASVNQAYRNVVLVDPTVSITIVERFTIPVLVLGEVNVPGVHHLPRGENDIARALAIAGGVTMESAEYIEVHRNPHRMNDARGFGEGEFAPESIGAPHVTNQYEDYDLFASTPLDPLPSTPVGNPPVTHQYYPTAGYENVQPVNRYPLDEQFRNHAPARPRQGFQIAPPALLPGIDYTDLQGHTPVALSSQAIVKWPDSTYVPPTRNFAATAMSNPMPSNVQTIQLRGRRLERVSPDQITLEDGDVLVIPRRPQEVFYVVGKLNRDNATRFNLDLRDREIGSGFLLPADRDIDVVTAVAMAGYIDPIDSPTTVSVHRIMPDGKPLMVRVDLIEARYECRENLIIQPGDIVYLNPDGAWWFRRTLDGVISRIIGAGADKLYR